MTRSIELTMQVIGKSKNQAADDLLEAAFQSTHEGVRTLAGNILASRRSGKGFDTIIQNFDPNDPYYTALVQNNREKLLPGLRGAIVSKDSDIAEQAFQFVYSQNIF